MQPHYRESNRSVGDREPLPADDSIKLTLPRDGHKTGEAPASDADLIVAIQCRSNQAFEMLYDRYSGLVFAVALRVLQNQDDAEEATIDTFFEIWQRPDRFDASRGSLPGFLAMLARSRSIDRLRSRQSAISQLTRSTPIDDGIENGQSPDGSPPDSGPATAVAYRDLQHKVQQAIDRLSSQQKLAIRLAFYEGLSHREIARQLDMPLGTVKSHIRLGLIQLRESFRTGNDGGPEQ